MTKRVDPRVARTRAVLREALGELMQTQRWEKIRVQDLLERTGVSRSAFYAHYGNKFELLTDSVPDFRLYMIGDRPDFLPLFVHIDEAADQMRPLLSQPVLGELVAEHHRVLVAMWTDYLAETGRADDWMLSEALVGGLMAIARTYASQDDREPPESLNERYNRFVDRILASEASTDGDTQAAKTAVPVA